MTTTQKRKPTIHERRIATLRRRASGFQKNGNLTKALEMMKWADAMERGETY